MCTAVPARAHRPKHPRAHVGERGHLIKSPRKSLLLCKQRGEVREGRSWVPRGEAQEVREKFPGLGFFSLQRRRDESLERASYACAFVGPQPCFGLRTPYTHAYTALSRARCLLGQPPVCYTLSGCRTQRKSGWHSAARAVCDSSAPGTARGDTHGPKPGVGRHPSPHREAITAATPPHAD